VFFGRTLFLCSCSRDVTTSPDPSFRDICKPTSCLYHVIPPQWDISVITRLRHSTSLPKPSLCTKNYCSSINYGLHHYQLSPSIILFVLFDCWFLFIILLCIRYLQLQCCQWNYTVL